MISFNGLVLGTELPIYQQIVLYIKRGIAAGTILTGDELPSRRMLSALLGVNPNTIQKAYRLLEEEGLISSHAGAKSLVPASAVQLCRHLPKQGSWHPRGRKSGPPLPEAGKPSESCWD